MSNAATVLLDTRPWVALHGPNDGHHDRAKQQFGLINGLLLSCEAVVAETCFTRDADFQIYRRHGRKVIRLLRPG